MNVQSTNDRTIEITTEEWLTKRGDCIIGISSNKSCFDLTDKIKNAIKTSDSEIEIKLIVEDEVDTIFAYGSPDLTLMSNVSMVIRKSDYISDRTLAIRADKSARDISRDLIHKLKDGADLEVCIVVKT